MSRGQGITHEQSFGEVVSKTFDLYRRDFAKYLVLFAVVGAITGVLTTLVRRAFILPHAMRRNSGVIKAETRKALRAAQREFPGVRRVVNQFNSGEACRN